MDREAFDAACRAETPESRHALAAFGPFDRTSFAFTAWFNEDLPNFAPGMPQNHVWPRHKALTRPLRHAIYIQSIVDEVQAAADEAVTEEQAESLRTTIQSEVERLEQEGPAND